jgi:hypothetical protein
MDNRTDIGPFRRGALKCKYDLAVGDAVCEALIVSELGLYSLLASRPDLPAWSTVKRWMSEVASFNEAIMRARDLRLERLGEGLDELAKEARSVTSAHEVQAVKIQVDTRKWLLSKLKPEVYGDRLDVTSRGAALPMPSHHVDARVQSIVMMAAERMRKHQELQASEAPSATDLLD